MAPKVHADQAPTVVIPMQTYHVTVSRWVFCGCWWAMFIVQAFLGAFAVAAAVLHRYVETNTTFAALQIPATTLEAGMWGFIVVAGGHTFGLATMVYRSIKARQLTFLNPSSTSSAMTQPPSRRVRLLSRLLRRPRLIWARVFGVNGYLGINGEYFEGVFLIKELVELSLQTNQAYRLSRSVPSALLNGIAVGSIAANCVLTSIIHMIWRRDDRMRRVIDMVGDMFLDFCCSVVIPLMITLPYAVAYDREEENYPDEKIMNDAWFVNAVSVNRQVLATSPMDMVATIIPQFSLMMSLRSLKSLVLSRPPSPRVQDLLGAIDQARLTATANAVVNGEPAIRPAVPTPKSRASNMRKSISAKAAQITRSRKLRPIMQACFLLWGVAVVALHLEARHRTSRLVDGCQLYVSGWKASGFECSVMIFNCHAYETEGHEGDLTPVFDRLARESLQVLVFSHCPQLHVPPILSEFENLIGLEIFNSTIVSWPMEAALREATHPKIGYLYLILTDWVVFPAGLLHRELPGHLNHLVIQGGNVTELPVDIGQAWDTHEWILIALGSLPQLRAIPESLCAVSTQMYAIIDTGIQSLPDNCFQNIEYVIMSANPLVALPALDPGKLWGYYAEYTNATHLPPWLSEEMILGLGYFSLFGSPVCDSSANFPSLEAWNHGCLADTGSYEPVYSWDLMLPQRALDVT